MFGLPLDSWRSPVLEETIPAVVSDLVPGVPYLPSPRSAGTSLSPNRHDALLRRRWLHAATRRRPPRGIRFAAECLAFGTPPEPETIDEAFGGPRVAGHDSRWKATVPRDPGMSWDYEEAGAHYVRELSASIRSSSATRTPSARST